MDTPIILTEDRNYTLAYYLPDERGEAELKALREAHGGVVPARPQPMAEVTLVPGLNYVDEEELRKARFNPDKSNVHVIVRCPTTMGKRERIELAATTTSRRSLLKWLELEKDAEVRNAITAKLTKIN